MVFTTPMGLFEVQRMLFGLCNGPATFQRLMESCLWEQNYQSLLIYLADIIAFAADFETHLDRVDLVFSRLSAQGLKLRPAKCKLLQSGLHCLGHFVSESRISPDPNKVVAVQMAKMAKRKLLLMPVGAFKGSEHNDANYRSFKLELLALKWPITETFHQYLLGSDFVVYTDNNPLAHLSTARLGAVEQQWVARLASYWFLVRHWLGT